MMMDARLPWPGMKILIRRTNKFCVAVLAEKKANRSTQFKIEMLAATSRAHRPNLVARVDPSYEHSNLALLPQVRFHQILKRD